MSLSSSIFRKPCPACAASVSVNAARCNCGHIFESSAHSLSPLEVTLRDEELYENYLAARADQARQAARAAEEALARNSGDPELVSAAALAREVAMSIDGDLAEQRKKIAGIRNAIRNNKPAALPDMADHATVPEMSASPRPEVTLPTPMRPVIAAEAAPSPAAVVVPSSLPGSATSPAWHVTTAQKAAAVLAAIKNAKAREAVARARPVVSATEPAERAMTASAPLPLAASAASSTASPSDFRKEQSARAERIMEARRAADSKECPNCTSSVPIATTRCRCGFHFVTSDTELPSLTLCTGDFTALRNSLKLNLR